MNRFCSAMMSFVILFPAYAGTITVNYPNGGEILYGGTSVFVTWSSTDVPVSINIDVSLDSQASWTRLVTGTANDGTESIVLPNSTGTHCYIRVQSNDGGFTFDSSDMPFMLQPGPEVIAVTHPWAGQFFQGNMPLLVSWVSTNASAFVGIQFSYNSGFTWQDAAYSTFNDGVESVTPPLPVPSMSGPVNTLVRVRDIDGNPQGTSGYFTLHFDGGGVLNAPAFLNGFPLAFNQVHLSWMDTSIGESNFEIQRSTDPMFMAPTPFITGANQTFFSDFGVQPNTTYYYRVRAVSLLFLPQFSAYSNTVAVTTPPPPPPSLLIQYPLSGAMYAAGQQLYVSFSAQYAAGPIDIDFSSDGGVNWTPVGSQLVPMISTNANYSTPVQPPAVISSACRVRLTDRPTGISVQSGDFRLVLPFDLIQPGGGEVYLLGQTQIISVYDPAWVVDEIHFEFSRDGGANWEAVGSAFGSLDRSFSGFIPFEWTVSGSVSNDCRIRASAIFGVDTLSAVSSPFTITTGIGTGGAPTGPAGGDLTGTYPDPLIAALAVTTPKIADSAVTAGPVAPFGIGGKISSAGMSPDRLLASDGAGGTLWKHIDDVIFGTSGLTAAQQFVNKQGDTMSGPLNLPQNGLKVGTQLLVTAGGKVGIGTGTPASKLTVSGVIETDNGVKFPDASKQTSAVRGGVFPVTLAGKSHVETITDSNVKAGSIIVVSLLDGDSATTNNKDTTLTLRQVSNGSFKVFLDGTVNLTPNVDKIHYIILVSP